MKKKNYEKKSELSLYVENLRSSYHVDFSILKNNNWMNNIDDELDGKRTGDHLVRRDDLSGGKYEMQFRSGKRVTVYPNGTSKKVYPDGSTVVYFNNGDIKKTFANNCIVYYYAAAFTTHTTFPNGLNMYEFANKQIEKHYPEGTKEIIFNNTIKYVGPGGAEEVIWRTDVDSQSKFMNHLRAM